MFALCRKSAQQLAAGIILMMSAACTLLGPPLDPQLGREQQQQAELLIESRQYKPAAELISLAAQNLPHDGYLCARLGEIYEQLQQFDEARETYRRGLKQASDNLIDLRYQLARLEAYHYQRLGQAEKLAKDLPDKSWQRADLQALILIRQGKSRKALEILSELVKRVPDPSAASFILFDAALANEQLDNIPGTFGSLYESVNRVEHKGLSRQIENYWNYLNETYPLKERAGS